MIVYRKFQTYSKDTTKTSERDTEGNIIDFPSSSFDRRLCALRFLSTIDPERIIGITEGMEVVIVWYKRTLSDLKPRAVPE